MCISNPIRLFISLADDTACTNHEPLRVRPDVCGLLCCVAEAAGILPRHSPWRKINVLRCSSAIVPNGNPRPAGSQKRARRFSSAAGKLPAVGGFGATAANKLARVLAVRRAGPQPTKAQRRLKWKSGSAARSATGYSTADPPLGAVEPPPAARKPAQAGQASTHHTHTLPLSTVFAPRESHPRHPALQTTHTRPCHITASGSKQQAGARHIAPRPGTRPLILQRPADCPLRPRDAGGHHDPPGTERPFRRERDAPVSRRRSDGRRQEFGINTLEDGRSRHCHEAGCTPRRRPGFWLSAATSGKPTVGGHPALSSLSGT